MAAITPIIISLWLSLPRVVPGQAPGLTPVLRLHKCCQRGELLSLHSKECIADRKKAEDNIPLPVLSLTRETYPDHLVTFDFVALEGCQTKQRVNLYFDVYGVDRVDDLTTDTNLTFRFLDKHAVNRLFIE